MKLELDMKEERIQMLTKELNDVDASSSGDNELNALKRLKHDLELKLKEQVGLIKLYYNVHENTV
jgi:hypothetical protein